MWYNGVVNLHQTVSARLPREQLARARSLSIIEGCFARGHMACTSGTVLTGFALWLGASPLVIGLLASLPAFAGLAQLAAPYFTDRLGQRKSLVIAAVAAQRLLWVPVAILPFLGVPVGVAMFLLVALVSLSSMLSSFASVPWLSWMGDLVPREIRGRYFATRNILLGVVALVLGPALGQFLDLWKAMPAPANGYGFLLSFGFGVACGLVSLVVLRRVVEPPMAPGTEGSLLSQLRLPWQNQSFRRLIVFRGYYIFMVNLAGPFFVVFYLQELGLGFGAVYILSALGSLASLVSLRWWGPLCDKWGNRRVMVISAVGKGIFPLLYIGMGLTASGSPTNLTWVLLIIVQLFSVAESGLELAANNLPLNVAPRQHNTAYLATYAAVFSLCSAVSPLIGGALLSQFSMLSLIAGPLTLSAFQTLFFASGLLRLSSVFFARRVSDR